MRDDIKKAAASGALSGSILGGGGALLSGAGLRGALRNALIGGLGGGALSGAGVGLGGAVLGEPEEGEINPYTRRAALGGSLAGAAVGAGGGFALAKGIGKASRHPIARLLAGRHPGLAAALGAGIGGLVGAYQGGDEGMQVDFLQNELEAQKKKRRAEKLARDIVSGRYMGGVDDAAD